MGSEEHSAFFQDDTNELSSQHLRLLENCLAMGAPSSKKGDDDNRCRILFTINTAGAGSGRQLLWETNPPPNDDNDKFTTNWSHPIAHLQRNLQEIDALCSTGNIVARVQVLVCQPISAYWTEWMDSQLPNCGGGLVATDMTNADRRTATVENRPSPLQMVVVATHKTAQLCLDQKSGFMEQRMQDLILAPPYLDGKSKKQDPAIKSTSPFLVSR